jgi:hypothetical protein
VSVCVDECTSVGFHECRSVGVYDGGV